MIREFWVENFLSIRDKQILNFEAKGPESALISEVDNNVFLYKLGILYGANASGKSNMLIALNEVFRILVYPKSDASVGISGYLPFILAKDKPTQMYVSFYADSIRYDYEVVFDKKRITHESLRYYPNGSKLLFYERTFIEENVQADIKFGPSLKLADKTKDSIRENTLNNHSVLSVCRKIAYKEDIAPFIKLHSWIMDNYHDVDGDGDGTKDNKKGIVDIMKAAFENPRKRNFYNQMLNKADLNIVEFIPIVKDRIVPNDFREWVQQGNIPNDIKEDLLKTTMESISFVNNSNEGHFSVPLSLQSRGTQKYIRILDALFDMITGQQVFYLDELGEDLHYDLLFYYLNVFLYNSNKSQLIITSQETALLSQDIINENRGAVWFVEKNKDKASSEYSRGDSFGLHKNLSFYNSYRIGRLGAKPELGSIFVNIDEE
ncbi:MAG: ATP-binding protein [Bacteroidales bacterium]|nr:ATP-binding protein [Bacteroidales bacterium]